MKLKFLINTAAAALLVSTPAFAQMWENYDSTTGYDGFHIGFTETGYYDAWDSDNDGLLSGNEFGTGVYSRWDVDNDNMISEPEFMTGTTNWYGNDYNADFAAWDMNRDGMLEVSEFQNNWSDDYWANWDSDRDGLLNEEEYSAGLYDTADLDKDQYVTIEEEGWFEGWFDGDDIEAEIREVGSMYN